MIVHFSKDHKFGRNTEKCIALLNCGTLSKLRDAIFPFLNDGPFLNDIHYNEMYQDLIQTMDEEECIAACEDMYPRIPEAYWQDFHVAFVIDLGKLADGMNSWDYYTNKMLLRHKLRIEELYGIAKDNLAKLQVSYQCVEAVCSDIFGITYYIVRSCCTCSPSYANSILVLPGIWKSFNDIIKEECYVIPLFRETIHVFPCKDVKQAGKTIMDLQRKLRKTYPFYMEFSSKYFMLSDLF